MTAGAAAPVAAAPGGARRSRGLLAAGAGARLAWLGVLGLWLALTLPLALGQRTLYFRDVFKTHLPLKAFGAAELASGRVPALNPTSGLGQPFRGNPNALAFYPGNLLYLALPFFPAFNLHYALHWLLALVGAYALARGLEQSPPAALLAALVYAGGGWMLSALTFYNLLAVAAWWPWVLAGARRGGVRGTALGGLACGMALLAGEPVTAALGLVPLAMVVATAHGPRAWRTLAGMLGLGAAVALPQIVATLRVLPFTVRGRGGLDPAAAGLFAFHPLRLGELVVPFPFGLPGAFGPEAWWPGAWGATVPFVLTIFAGTPALWLALQGVRSRAGWAVLAAAGVVVAGVPAGLAQGIARLSGGLVRHPEKTLFWTALAAALLAGWGLDRLLAARRPRRFLGVLAASAVGLALALLAGLFATDVGAAVGARLREQGMAPAEVERAVAGTEAHWELRAQGLALGAGSLALAALAMRRRRPHLVAGCQLLSLLALQPLWMTEPVAPYRRPAGETAAGAPGALVIASLPDPPWERLPVPDLPSRGHVARWLAMQPYPAPGALQGFTYPLPPDVDGMVSPLLASTAKRLARASWSERVVWSRRLGAETLVAFAQLPGLAGERAAGGIPGAPIPRVYRLGPAPPPARWPGRVLAARPGEERLLAGLADDTVVAARAVEHRPGGRVRWLAGGPDRLELEVESAGGIVVVMRAWQPSWRARAAGGGSLPILAVDGLLLGVEVPPGRVRVRAAVSALPEAVAGLVALLAAAFALAAAWRHGAPHGLPAPPG